MEKRSNIPWVALAASLAGSADIGEGVGDGVGEGVAMAALVGVGRDPRKASSGPRRRNALRARRSRHVG